VSLEPVDDTAARWLRFGATSVSTTATELRRRERDAGAYGWSDIRQQRQPVDHVSGTVTGTTTDVGADDDGLTTFNGNVSLATLSTDTGGTLAFGSGVTSVSTTACRVTGRERNVGAYGWCDVCFDGEPVDRVPGDVDRHDDGRGGANEAV